MMRILLCLIIAGQVQAFLPSTGGRSRIASFVGAEFRHRRRLPLNSVQQDEEVTISEAERLRKEAEAIRLQAEKMDLSLTLEKIEALESKLQNKAWLEKYPEKEADLKMQLDRLNQKLSKSNEPQKTVIAKDATTSTTTSSPKTETTRIASKEYGTESYSAKKALKEIPKVPLAGFDDTDLELYIPIANDINKMMENATIEEKLEMFRTAPELQAHFQAKIQKMLIGPMEELQQLETLKNEYLKSSSSKERESLKRQIEKLENSVDDDGPFMYSDGLYCENLPPLSEEEFELRLETMQALPDILISIYKQRNGLVDDDELSLAIQCDYYDPQTQLLEQVRALGPLTDETREDFAKGFNSLPEPVQNKLSKKYGLEEGSDAGALMKKLLDDSEALSPLMEVVQASNLESSEPPEYNDIDFVDRSRYLEEFFPAVGNMEGIHPSLEDVTMFANQVLDKKCFMVTSKPERVAGGYYVRGNNLLNDDEDGNLSAADKLVAQVVKDVENSPLKDKLEVFYILDPSPPTDEEMELGPVDKPLFLVTTKNREKLYSWAKPLTKTVISSAGLLTTFMFAVGACALNPAISDRFGDSLDSATATGVLDLTWLSDLCLPLFTALVGIQLAHELAHRAVALYYKFDVGIPNIIPSILTGLTGAITPLKSPPPSSKSLFDFAIAGPLVGLGVSVALLLNGLEITASTGIGSQLPVVPVDLLRASSLGGGLVQFVLGSGSVMPQGPEAVLQLHPYAIAGFIGCITNALALLPLGHTDGGRIAVAMFGRRGAFVVKLFTTLSLCAAGIFGVDEFNILLVYVLFASIWQRELEAPARNEVDELDFPRGLLGITAAIAVGLVLIPMFY